MAKGFCTSDTEKLAAAICSLAQAIEESSKTRKSEFDWLKSHFLFATKQDLKEMECRIMSKISDFLTKQETFNTDQEKHIDEVVAAIAGVSGDVTDLLRIIKELQDSPGGVTPEDQARIDQLEIKGAALSAKLKGASDALVTLDQQHPPVVPPPTTV